VRIETNGITYSKFILNPSLYTDYWAAGSLTTSSTLLDMFRPSSNAMKPGSSSHAL
jgi:hypothetical protein